MANYIDSSILLSVLLKDSLASKGAEIWDSDEERISSSLFEVECRAVIRRKAKDLKTEKSWLASRESLLDEYLSSITIKPIDDEILQVIRLGRFPAECRSLDLIHLATASFFRPYIDGPFRFCTFDRRLADAAKSVGFEIYS